EANFGPAEGVARKRLCAGLFRPGRTQERESGKRCAIGVALWEEVGYVRAQRAGVEGLLPLLHLGSVIKLGAPTVAPFRGTFDHTLDAKNRLTVPARYRAVLADGVVLAMPVDLKPCVGVWHPEEYERYSRRALAELPPLSPRRAGLERFFYGSSQDT